MNGSKRRHVLGLCVVLAAGLLVPATAQAASSVTRNPDGSLSVEARGVPIGTLLRELASKFPFGQLLLDPGVSSHPVSVRLDSVPYRDALTRILEKSGLDFVILGGGAGHELRVFVGDLESAVEVPRAASRNEDVSTVPNRRPAPRVPPPNEDGDEEALRRRNAALKAQRESSPSVPDEASPDDEVFATEQFTMHGENVVYHDPAFTTYKASEKARRARMSMDVSKIP